MSDPLKTTIDPEEASRFERLASLWWDLEGPFWPLHRMNQLRTQWIKAEVLKHFDLLLLKNEKPLSGLRVLDIGCGGGILSEAMARLGATVTGIDVVDRNLRIANHHAEREGLAIDYRCIAAENLAQEEPVFDVVLNMEVVEHVIDLPLFLKSAATLVRPGGMMIVATLNRTLLSYLVAIIGAEYLFGWLPKGTHQWCKFVKPSELDALLRGEGFKVVSGTGVWMNPISRSFLPVPSTGVNYMLCFTHLKNVSTYAPSKDGAI
jgi:2-polyprenyl-6-hydroxyphenyl methylase/3-demethylubiquinone-9 3-methyltransferase